MSELGLPFDTFHQFMKELITHEEIVIRYYDKTYRIKVEDTAMQKVVINDNYLTDNNTFTKIDPKIKKQLDRIEAALAALSPQLRPKPAKGTDAKPDSN